MAASTEEWVGQTGAQSERGLPSKPNHIALTMKAPAPRVPLRDWLLKRPDWLDHETVVGLVFAFSLDAIQRSLPITATTSQPGFR